MKPYIHALSSVRKHKGSVGDYLDIHQFLDSSKESFPDNRHRSQYHHSAGCFLCEKIFGVVRVNSDGKEYSVRDIAEEHIIEDLGCIPSVDDYLSNMESVPWMNGVIGEYPPSHRKIAAKRTTTFTPFKERD